LAVSGRRVLVTRPQPAAAHTAARLAEAGFEPLVLPLSETVALPVQNLPDPAAFDVVAITSANAVRHASSDLLSRLRGKQCYAVGERSGEAAMKAGLSLVRADAGDAQGLTVQMVAEMPRGTRLLYLCGKIRRPDFADGLAGAGFTVQPLETYDTRDVHYTDDAVGDTIGWNPIWGAAVYSAGGAGRLARLMGRPQLAMIFAQTRFFCLSERSAAALGKGRASSVAAQATEDALLQLMVA
jgi:uroporphyrinogen-III synthase